MLETDVTDHLDPLSWNEWMVVETLISNSETTIFQRNIRVPPGFGAVCSTAERKVSRRGKTRPSSGRNSSPSNGRTQSVVHFPCSNRVDPGSIPGSSSRRTFPALSLESLRFPITDGAQTWLGSIAVV